MSHIIKDFCIIEPQKIDHPSQWDEVCPSMTLQTSISVENLGNDSIYVSLSIFESYIIFSEKKHTHSKG